MKKKDEQQKPYRAKISAALVSTYAFLAIGVVGMLAFLSPHTAFIACGLGAISLILYFDQRWRGFWEQASSFQMLSLRKDQKKLSDTLEATRSELNVLKDDISEVRQSLQKIKAKSQEPISLRVRVPAQESADDVAPDMERIKTKLRKIAPKPLLKPEVPVSSYQELVATRPSSAPVSVTRIANDEPAYSKTAIKNLIRHAVHSRDIEMFVQPVMAIPQRKTRFYELYARLRAGGGNYVSASQFMELAREDGAEKEIDTLLLMECLRVMRSSANVKKPTPFFINITQATLNNTVFMKRLLDFISKNRGMAPRLIFEIAEPEYKNMRGATLQVVKGLGQLGCSFALGQCSSLDFDVPDLIDNKVRFVKIGKTSLSAHIMTDKALAETIKKKRILEGNGVGVIAEKIETERDLRELMDLDLNLAQGYLLGRPDLRAAYAKKQAA